MLTDKEIEIAATLKVALSRGAFAGNATTSAQQHELKRCLFLALWGQGLRTAQIAEAVGCSPRTIRKWKLLYKQIALSVEKPAERIQRFLFAAHNQGGRPPTQKRKAIQIIEQHLRNHSNDAPSVPSARELAGAAGVSLRTAQRVLTQVKAFA